MTNRINTETNQDLTIPLDAAKGGNDRRGVLVSFPRDITEDEICKVLTASGWWDILFGKSAAECVAEVENFAFIETSED